MKEGKKEGRKGEELAAVSQQKFLDIKISPAKFPPALFPSVVITTQFPSTTPHHPHYHTHDVVLL
jgi:hypothetical protein